MHSIYICAETKIREAPEAELGGIFEKALDVGLKAITYYQRQVNEVI